jgi:nicotinamide-nucleotide amidase
MDSLSDVAEQVAVLLKTRQWQLVTAESCTGGLIAGQITEIPGSSAWFERGFVTYSNRSKQEMLGVTEDLIIQQGAVSEAVAEAMANGALSHSQGHIALAVTGIAGPGGGTLEKPVGTICFAWAAKNFTTQSTRKLYKGNRHTIRAQACQDALRGIFSFLGG